MRKKQIRGELIDGAKTTVNVIIQRRKRDGTVIDEEKIHNIIVNDGLERSARLLCGDSSTYFRAIAIGTGVTGALATDSALETEVKRASATCAYEASYKSTFEKTFSFSSGESFAITEAGVFDSATASGSTMLNRFTFTAKNVDVDTDLYVKVIITHSTS